MDKEMVFGPDSEIWLRVGFGVVEWEGIMSERWVLILKDTASPWRHLALRYQPAREICPELDRIAHIWGGKLLIQVTVGLTHHRAGNVSNKKINSVSL